METNPTYDDLVRASIGDTNLRGVYRSNLGGLFFDLRLTNEVVAASRVLTPRNADLNLLIERVPISPALAVELGLDI